MNELMNGRSQNVPAQSYGSQGDATLAEIKGKMYLARQFPRDTELAMQRTLQECQQKSLAEAAQYEYKRGDSAVRGPSIRLVEVLARNWGNVAYGVREVEATTDGTLVEAYAWDLETNVSDNKVFTVKNERSTKNGSYKLKDSRDVYENMANNAARRKRACILSVLPGWYVDAAVEECDKTLKKALTGGGKVNIEEIRTQLTQAFSAIDVTPDMIREKIGRDVDHLTENDIVQLRRLYTTIKDGFVKAQDVFNMGPKSELPDLEEGDSEALRMVNKLLGGEKA